MNLYGLIGYPLSHSFSKKYFSEKFHREGIADAGYELFPIEHIESLPDLLTANPQLRGLNVTIPYKEQVLPYLNELSPEVKEIGACNCIRIQNGELTGFNTDVVGFEQSLLPLLSAHHNRALVLGTGGAAKAVLWVLKKNNISTQTVSRAGGAASYRYEELDESVLSTHTLIINTTPLGMQPNVNSLPSLPYAAMNERHLCYDLVYNPEKTAFLTAAEKQGAVIKNGLEMLQRQAEEAWRIWNE